MKILGENRTRWISLATMTALVMLLFAVPAFAGELYT